MFSTDDSFGLTDEDLLHAALEDESDFNVDAARQRPSLQASPSASTETALLTHALPAKLTVGSDSQAKSPVFSVVGPSGIAGARPVEKKTPPNCVGTKKFIFRKSPKPGGSAPGDTGSAAGHGAPVVLPCRGGSARGTTGSGPQSSSPAPAAGGNLFAISQDSIDSDLDLSLDSDLTFPTGAGTTKPVQTSSSWRAPSPVMPVIASTWRDTPSYEGQLPPGNGALQRPLDSPDPFPQPLFKTPLSRAALRKPMARPPVLPQELTVQAATPEKRPMSPAAPGGNRGVSSNKTASSPAGWGTPQALVSSASESCSSEPGETSKRKRKFPGPAGLLPQLPEGEAVDNPSPRRKSPKTSPQPQPAALPSSQVTENVFRGGAWTQMLNELEPQASHILEEYSLTSLQKKASRGTLPRGKVPVVCAVVDAVILQNEDASVVLRDPTGTIKGSVHRQLLKEHASEISVGTVLVLRQVAVFSPNIRSHYLNITPSNVVRMYSKAEGADVSTQQISHFSAADFVIPAVPDVPAPSTPTLGSGASNFTRPAAPDTPLSRPTLFSASPALGADGRRHFQFKPRSPAARAPAAYSTPRGSGAGSFPRPPGFPAQRTPGFPAQRPRSPGAPQYQRGTMSVSGTRQTGNAGNIDLAGAKPQGHPAAPPVYRPATSLSLTTVSSSDVSKTNALRQRNPNVPAASAGHKYSDIPYAGPRSASSFATSTAAARPTSSGDVSPAPRNNPSAVTSSGRKHFVSGGGTAAPDAAGPGGGGTEALWGDNDEQLDDLLTGIRDELFDAF